MSHAQTCCLLLSFGLTISFRPNPKREPFHRLMKFKPLTLRCSISDLPKLIDLPLHTIFWFQEISIPTRGKTKGKVLKGMYEAKTRSQG